MSTTGTFTQTVGSATAARFQNAAGTTTVLVVDTTNTRVGVNAGTDVNTTFEVGGTASISGVSTWADGQFRPQSNGTTAFRFQNAAGTTSVLTIDTTNARIGIGGTPGTTFEVQGTASASYFLTGNTIQVGGFSSVAYSRFGTNTTTYSNDLTTTNDLLISGNLEVDLKSFFDAPGEFQGTASASYFLTGNTIQVGGFASAAYSRFGTAATGHSTDIDTTNDLLISGALEVDGKAFFDGTASVAGDFEVIGRASASSAFVTKNFVVGSNVASSSTAYVAEFVSAATTSVLFGGSSTTLGTCLRMKNTTGQPVYARVFGTTFTISAISCR